MPDDAVDDLYVYIKYAINMLYYSLHYELLLLAVSRTEKIWLKNSQSKFKFEMYLFCSKKNFLTE